MAVLSDGTCSRALALVIDHAPVPGRITLVGNLEQGDHLLGGSGMITDRDPTPEEFTKLRKSQRSNCVAAALFAITLGAIAILEIVRARSDGEMRIFGYILLAVAAGYVFVFWRSLRQYREMAN